MTVSRRGQIVIVGAGIAGVGAAKTLRREGFTGSIVLAGAEQAQPYRRPMVSKELLSGAAGAERARLEQPAFWADMSIELRTATIATRLDTDAARVELGDGSDLAYDAVVLATGGRAKRLDHLVPEAYTVRQLADLDALRPVLGAAGKVGETLSVLVFGGGLIGMEVAAAVRGSGAEVTVLEAADRVLERVLPGAISASYERLHRDRGVGVHTGVRLVAAETRDAVTTVSAEDGRSWRGDVVIVAVGMAPESGLAEAAGLTVADGVLVDEYCAASAPAVFAAGDVARFPNPILGGTERVEHWNHAQAHGSAAARSVLGHGSPYRDVPWCWTSQFGRTLQIAGWPTRGDELVVHGDLDGGSFLALSLARDRLIGALGVGRPKDVRAAQDLIGDGAPLPRDLLGAGDLDLVAAAATLRSTGAPAAS
ncbi:NAD(P)/FAD-dependent oxidoreductase [Nocardia sp. NPDC060259]|uniref:NAD(P)/FAD-dependent oxidoreductase n=1 Tax=Nocardia sp. NPDC060259 TaxID=3347088 RepID=UPI0036522338